MVETDPNKPINYDPITRLSGIAEKFISQDEKTPSMKKSLQECIDTFANYQDECKKIKNNGPSMTKEEIYPVYESAYIYYKIMHIIVLNRIPNSSQFEASKSSHASNKDKELLHIYNKLVKLLLSDDRIAPIKAYIRANYNPRTNPNNSTGNTNGTMIKETFDLPLSGSNISSTQLNHLIQMYNDSLLLIDVRPRTEFDKLHIKAKSVICIEPISFKSTYTDLDIEKKSMVTSPQQEVSTFQQREKYQFIVLYTREDDKTQFFTHQQLVLVDILMNKSITKPLNRSGTKLFILSKGITNWKARNGSCEETIIEPIDNKGNESVYINGNTAELNLQDLPELSPNVGLRMDNSMKEMMSGTSSFEHSSYGLPQQQLPVLERTPSFKKFFSRSKSSFNSSQSNQSSPPRLTNSPSAAFLASHDFAQYPKTPHLMTQFNSSEKTLAQISPIDSKTISPNSKSLTSISSQKIMPINSQNALQNRLKALPASRSSHPPSQPIPALPQMPNSSTNSYLQNAAPTYDLEFTVGMENMGNSCYMNCIIQCLLSTHELVQMFLNNSYEKHININSKLGSKGVLARYFAKLVHNMYREGTAQNSSRPVRPNHFKLACGSINSVFKGNMQQDCQEFCQFLLDGLHEDLNQCGANPPLKELSPNAEKMREKLSMRIASSIEWERFLTTDFSVIVDLFQGQYASQLKCKICSTTSTTYQTFSVLSVPVPKVKSCFLLDCFNEFTKIENLEADELWSCPHCKQKQPSTKKLTITRLPKNLIIHLKRFDNMMNKNNVFVKYPLTLDLTPFWANDFDGQLPPGVTEELPTRGQVPPFKYKLNGVATHTGSLQGGHYTSYVNKGINKGWYYYDDASFRRVKHEPECITPNAYVLFYHRIYGY